VILLVRCRECLNAPEDMQLTREVNVKRKWRDESVRHTINYMQSSQLSEIIVTKAAHMWNSECEGEHGWLERRGRSEGRDEVVASLVDFN